MWNLPSEQPVWHFLPGVKPAYESVQILLRIADLIMEKLDELALAESTDNGKPVSLATEVDIPKGSSEF